MSTPASKAPSSLRAALAYGLPSLVLVGLFLLPVILGSQTFFLRDVLNTHAMLHVGAVGGGVGSEGISAPVLGALRGGGQPYLGNPNAFPLYPTQLLRAVAEPLRVLNIHLWLHWLLAFAGAYALGRAWGLSPGGSWCAALAYGLSGFLVSLLNLANLIAGAALAPALVAAVLGALRGRTRRRRRLATAAVGLLWALLLLAGDPQTAVLALGAAGLAGLVVLWRERRARAASPDETAADETASAPPGSGSSLRTLVGLAAAGLAGTLVAAPQLVELLRALPASFRGVWGQSAGTAGTLHPLRLVELLVPWPYGRFDQLDGAAFWAGAFETEVPPLLLSLYPGLLPVALGVVLIASGRALRGPAVRWAWSLVALGLFFSLGGYNPLAAALFELPGLKAFRYPVKLWLLVALGGAVLAGRGFEVVFGGAPAVGDGEAPEPPRPALLAWVLGGLAVLLMGFLGLAVAAPETLARLLSASGEVAAALTGPTEEAGRPPWTAVAPLVLILLALSALTLLLARRRPGSAAALLLVLFTAGQLALLRPAMPTDAAAPYGQRPALASVALAGGPLAGETLVSGTFGNLFPAAPAGTLPDRRIAWLSRRAHRELWPFAGLAAGIPYEMAPSPEGIDTFLSRVARDLVRQAPSDLDRVRVLSVWGVGGLVMVRPLEGVPPELAREVPLLGAVSSGLGRRVAVYGLPRRAERALFAEEVRAVGSVQGAWELLVGDDFDPDRTALLPPSGEGPESSGAGDAGAGDVDAGDVGAGDAGTGASAEGSVEVLRWEGEVLELEVEAPVPGALVVQRSLAPQWRATVDGEPVEIEAANLYRMGVRLPAGRHRVRFAVDRGPTRLAFGGAALGLLGLVGFLGWSALRRDPEPVQGAPQDP